MKNSNIQWIGDIPDNWKVLKNKYNFELSKGIVGVKSASTQLLSLTKNGIKAITEDQQNGKVPASFNTYQVVKKDDIVMCLFDLDVSAVFSGISNYDGMISPAYKCFKCKTHLNPKYVDYYFRAVFVDRKYKRYSKNVRYSISAEEFMTLPILVPPLPTQTAIANFLDSKCSEIDTLITDINKQIDTLNELKKSTITEAVTKGVTIKSIIGTNIEYVNNGNTKWSCKKLKLLTDAPIIDGPHESPTLYDSGIPFISATAIINGKIDFNLRRGYVSEQYSKQCDLRYKPQINDILLVKLGASAGDVAIVDTNTKFNIWVPLAAIRCSKNIVPKFIFYCFNSNYVVSQMQQSWTYGTQETLGIKTIEKLKFLLPTLSEQQQIADYLDAKCSEFDAIISDKQKQISTLETYKKSLIYEYVTGKKEV